MQKIHKNSATIRIRDLCMTYSNGHQALQSISLCLSHSTICALVGVNGSGKSTLFNSIMGLVSPQQGKIELADLPVKKALKQKRVAYVPQSEEIDWSFPILVKDVVMQGRFGHMGFLRIARSKDKALVEESMEKLEITHLANRQIGELSGGQKKRVFLARAIAQQSKIILLDEPFTGVDVTTENAIMELMKGLREEGYLMLVATHNLGTVPDYCNEVVLLNQSIIAAGKTEIIYTQENLEKTFGGVLKSTKLGGSTLHEDGDDRGITILTDDERPVVFYGKTSKDSPLSNQTEISSN